MRFLKRKLFKKSDSLDIILYILISLVFFLGVIYGVLQADTKNDNDIIASAYALKNDIFITAFLKNIRIIAWISLFSLSVIGFPGILYFDYVKGYSLGISVYTIILASQGGVFSTAMSFIPFLICNITAVILLSKQGGKLSFYLLNLLLKNKNTKNDRYIVIKFALFAIFSSLLMAISGFAELLITKNFNWCIKFPIYNL